MITKVGLEQSRILDQQDCMAKSIRKPVNLNRARHCWTVRLATAGLGLVSEGHSLAQPHWFAATGMKTDVFVQGKIRRSSQLRIVRRSDMGDRPAWVGRVSVVSHAWCK
jgi:hypothetical protein